MTSQIHIDMHREHKLWEAEIDQWRFQVAEWQKQLKTFPAALAALNTKLDEHAESLRKHAGSIRMLEQEVGDHEHEIVQYEMGGTGEELPGLVVKHKLASTRRNQQSEAHARLKQVHHDIMAQWNHLLKTVGVELKSEQSSRLLAGEP